MHTTSCLNYDTDVEIFSRDGSLPPRFTFEVQLPVTC